MTRPSSCCWGPARSRSAPGVMVHGYGLVKTTVRTVVSLHGSSHGFKTIDEFRGHSLQYFTTHAELVRRQADIKAAGKAAKAGMVTQDKTWDGEKFVEQSDKLVAND